MAKPNIPNQKSKYNALNKRLSNYVALVRQIYDVLNLEAAKMAESVKYKEEGKEFHFKDYPELTDRVKKLQSSFVSDISSAIYTGTSQEWKNSNLVQDLVADKVLKTYGARVSGQKYKLYYQTNSDALKAFQERKDRGLNLSQKIWNQSQNYKTELEYAISTAIQKGTSAVTLSKRISKYLLDFKSLQKDYKAKYGKAVDCYDCEYRSIRLARSEINLAYRTAEQKRWEQMDFVVGQEIKLSNNHTCNGVPFVDICDDLAGKYPKDFKFTGWHPMCRCYVIPILKTEDEFWGGGDVPSKNNIDDIPPQFKEWISDNTERIKKAKAKGTLPYFVRDNKYYISEHKISHSFNSPSPLGNVKYNAFNEFKITKAQSEIDSYQEAISALSNLYGKKYTQTTLFKDMVNSLGVKGDFSKALDVFYSEYEDNMLKYVLQSVNRIEEIKNADITKMYNPWREKFEEYIAKISKHNILQDGYIDIYREIEGAYNILQLLSDDFIIEFGLNKISLNTPYNLIKEFRKAGLNPFDFIAKKEMYDKFDIFIPAYVYKHGVSEYNPNYNHVKLVFDERLGKSSVYPLYLQYHEFGHAMDRSVGEWSKRKEWIELYDKHSEEFNKDAFEFGRKPYYGINIKNKYFNEFEKTSKTLDDKEYAIAVCDIFQSFDNSHLKFGEGGHDTIYYNSRTRCLAEFLAHASEIYWHGNPLLKKISPSLYKEIKDMYAKSVSLIK